MKTIEDVQKEIHASVYGPKVRDKMPAVFLCGHARWMAMHYFDERGMLIRHDPKGILDNVRKIIIAVPNDVEVEVQHLPGMKE